MGRTILNNRGMTLLGTMIAAGVGLLVIMGVSKSLITFSEQTVQTHRKQMVSQVSSNLASILRSNKMWNDSVNKMGSGCKYPGQKKGCNFELQRNGKRVTCNNGSTATEAIGYMSTSGSIVEDINCSKCKNDKMCGLDPKKYVRFIVSYKNKPNPSKPFEMPDFVARTEDVGGSKHASSVDIENEDGILIDPDLFKCPTGEYIAGVNNDGTPVCKKLSSELTKLNCTGGKVLVGVNPDGSPKCATVQTKVNISSCPGGKYMAGVSNNNPICKTLPKSTTTTIVKTGGGGGSSSPCGGYLPRNSYLHTGAEVSGTCRNQGLSCGKSNGNAAKCKACHAQWMYPNGCYSPPKCYCN